MKLPDKTWAPFSSRWKLALKLWLACAQKSLNIYLYVYTACPTLKFINKQLKTIQPAIS